MRSTLLLIGLSVIGIYVLGVAGFFDAVIRVLELLIELIEALEGLHE